MTGTQDNGNYGSVQQTIATISGATYSISFYVGASNGTSTVRVTAGNLDTTKSSTSASTTSPLWSQGNFQFVAAGANTPITLLGTAASLGGAYIGLDNVAVDLVSAPGGVPEPATFALVGLALAGLIGIRARR